MKKYFGIVLLGILALGILGCDETYVSHPFDAETIGEADKQAYTNAINTLRADTQICSGQTMGPYAKLKWNEDLYRTAYEHSQDMAHQSKRPDKSGSGTQWDHTYQAQHLSHPSTIDDRMRNNGYDYTIIHEIVLGDSNATTAQEAIEVWIKDASHPEHCKELMDANVTEFGMAHIHDDRSTYKNYWTIDLAKPAVKDTWF